MSDNPYNNLQEFQKIWTETLSKLAMTGLSVPTGTPPNEAGRAMRDGLFQAMTQMWDHYLRSSEFMEITKSSMDNSIAFKKLSNEFFNQYRKTTEGASRDDIQTLIQCVKQMDDSLRHQLKSIESRLEALEATIKESKRAPKRTSKK